MLQNRYQVSAEMLALTQTVLTLADETDDNGQIAWARFLHGFALLWHRDLDQAEINIAEALSVAESSGDLVHQAHCTTYLAVIRRMHSDLQGTERFARVALETARTV